MQTIAISFGAELEKCLSLGMTRIVTTAQNPLFSSTFQAYTLHNYSLKSHKGFKVLAESEECVQAIKLENKDIYGVLFHPEVRNQEIIKRFVRTFHTTE
jgi:GMP synthase (glutamine-hydrolysing)